MAKTIAMQRGTSTISPSSPATLFTQSGGYATRVICNQLVFYAASGSLYYPTCELALYNSSGPRTTLAMIYPATTAPGAIQFLPHCGQNNASHPVANSVQQFGAVGGPGSSSLGTSTNNGPNTTYWQANNVYTNLNIPSEFYIGPGDSLVAKYQNDNGSDVRVGWSFTTITET
jgi:hypothetical protein